MRIALFILLFANLAFLAWSQWVDVPSKAVTADATAGLPRLKLAEESAGAAVPTGASDIPAQAAPQAPKVAAVSACVSVGPFDDAASAGRGVDLLKKKGIAAAKRTQEAPAANGFWVIVGSLGNDAGPALQKLQENGIQDGRVLQATNKEQRITAGLYTTKDEANQRMQALKNLGLRATLAERPLAATRYWVDAATDGVVPANELYHGPMSKFGVEPCPDGTPPPTN